MNKATCERVHCRRRAIERYGKPLSRHTLHCFVQAIKGGRAVFLKRSSNSRTNWAVWHDAQWWPVVYHKGTQQILTVLPQSALRSHEQVLSAARSEQ